MKLARVLRIIEYVGEPEWVKACIATRQLKGRGDFPGHGYITEAILGDTSEILEYSALQAAAEDLVNRKICPVCEGGKKADSTACRTCGGLAYVSQIGDFDETAEELRRECAKAVGKVGRSLRASHNLDLSLRGAMETEPRKLGNDED